MIVSISNREIMLHSGRKKSARRKKTIKNCRGQKVMKGNADPHKQRLKSYYQNGKGIMNQMPDRTLTPAFVGSNPAGAAKKSLKHQV